MLKPIPSTMRERNRYIAFELISGHRFCREDVTKAVWRSSLRFLGERGVSETSLWMMEWDKEKQRGILKVNNRCVDDVRAALALMKEINKIRVIPYVFGVSGTVKKTREKYLS